MTRVRLSPALLERWAEYNEGVTRAIEANRAPGPDTVPRRHCLCGAYTRSDDGICRDCQPKGDT